MTKEVKVFPRNFRSSSAAYRAIRQHEERMKLGSNLLVTKINSKSFLVSLSPKITLDELINKHPNVHYTDLTYRYFSDGLNGEGYYELKIGDRRRPNSKFITIENIFTDLISETCKF